MTVTAEAAQRGDRGRESQETAQSQTAKPQQTKAVSATRPSTGTRQASRSTARRQTTALRPGDVRSSRSGTAMRGTAAATVSREAMAQCSRRNGRTVCGNRQSVAGWQAGLPRPDYAQRECPEGTFATLARGHDDVVRCMPL